jgi:hypothetical protein
MLPIKGLCAVGWTDEVVSTFYHTAFVPSQDWATRLGENGEGHRKGCGVRIPDKSRQKVSQQLSWAVWRRDLERGKIVPKWFPVSFSCFHVCLLISLWFLYPEMFQTLLFIYFSFYFIIFTFIYMCLHCLVKGNAGEWKPRDGQATVLNILGIVRG